MSVEVALFDLDLADEELAALEPLLDCDEQARAVSYCFARDRRRFVARRGQLRRLLAERLGTEPAALRFAAGTHGKPFLPDARELRFSVSFSNELALCATSWTGEVGCDIEAVNPANASPEVASAFFSAQENEALGALSPDQWLAGFFNCWTRKEAYVKALGEGLSHPLDAFTVSLVPDEPARLIAAAAGWTLAALEPAPGYRAAVVRECGNRAC